MPGYRTRFAPSPTGALHLGHARTHLVAWLRARTHAGGEIVMRIEDVDRGRARPDAAAAILAEHEWLGLDWDRGPFRQDTTERETRYAAVLAELAEHVFACSCSRKELAAAASADPSLVSDEGIVYPGTCRLGPRHPERPLALRFRFEAPSPGFVDAVLGEVGSGAVRGDFVLRRRDARVAYQLAVVVDDHDQGVSEVVRGADLLLSTPRQLALYDALGWARPRYLHLPLVHGPDGRRLAKSHGSVAIADYRAAGWSPEGVLGLVASSLGLIEGVRPVDLDELRERFRSFRLRSFAEASAQLPELSSARTADALSAREPR